MSVTQPIVSGVTAVNVAIGIGIAFVALVIIAIVETARGIHRQRRDEEQLKYERRLRKGLRDAQRLGWLPDDTQ